MSSRSRVSALKIQRAWMLARWIASTQKDEPGFEADSQLYIDPVECIDCGACVPVCPVSAIFALDDLPDRWRHFTQINAEHFAKEMK